MFTLRQLATRPAVIPEAAVWQLASLTEARGRQELYTRQSPQKLRVLREHALIESAVSSNRIEGVTVDQARVATVVFGGSPLRDRAEQELRGYRSALNEIHGGPDRLPLDEATILRLHQLSRGDVWDAGRYKEKDVDIIETSADGRSRVRFRPVSASATATAMAELVGLWSDLAREEAPHPIFSLAAFNLDFLCIHPFRDGNGRVSRLLMLLQCYHLGYEVGRYISLERLIEQNKERYYETLEFSSRDWHDGRHDPWPFIGYVLFILRSAYTEFEERVHDIKGPRGSKTELVLAAINAQLGEFRVADLQKACPGVSVDLIRRTLKRLRDAGQIECLGRGQLATWQRRSRQLGTTY